MLPKVATGKAFIEFRIASHFSIWPICAIIQLGISDYFFLNGRCSYIDDIGPYIRTMAAGFISCTFAPLLGPDEAAPFARNVYIVG